MANPKDETPSLKSLEQSADEALFGGALTGVIAACYANERPLQGLAS